MSISSNDLQNGNWAEFDLMEQKENESEVPKMIPTTEK